ncbi:hypothetical protein CBI55_26775 [Pseudomonas syringae]|nr:hypothetical protein CBI55_26775 [Pseudomonas syringae]POP68315.1 hypothetical protein CXB35_17295 [Pseudomonas syringae]POP73654.1 hypothetical protein CXB38_27790 [Pseudomonas syringae]
MGTIRLLPGGRRSELVREGGGSIAENASTETPSSLAMRIAAPVAPTRVVYNDKHLRRLKASARPSV